MKHLSNTESFLEAMEKWVPCWAERRT